MRWALPWCLLVVVAAGCVAESKHADLKTDRPAERSPAASAESAPADKANSPPPPGTEALQRKIIYTATVNLVVEQFDPVPAEVEALVKRFEAYVAHSQITGSPGSPRRRPLRGVSSRRPRTGRGPGRAFRLPGRDRGVL